MMANSDSWIASSEAERFDIELAQYDCWATQAHVLMLRQQEILSASDAQPVLRALIEIEGICRAGEFRYEPGLGAQLTLEKMIVDRVGPAIGHQVHTGRSRNDQVLTAQKLFVRDAVLRALDSLAALLDTLVARAHSGAGIVMPGYTHMQPARPTTVGQWCAAYADMYLRDLNRLRDAYERHNTNPLGAAESHGTSWSLDRAYTQELLAFTGIDEIPLDAISSRGESDADFLSATSFVALHVSKIAQDLLLFNTFEYGYVELSEEVATRMGKLTGSSIMPQKRNPDVLELLRAQSSEIYSSLFHALELLKGLPSGYNRDSRDTKAPVMRGLHSITSSLTQLERVVATMIFDEDAMYAAVTRNYSMATDLAEYLAQRHAIPFRIMHRIVGRSVAQAIAAQRTVAEIPPATLAAEAAQEGYELDVGDAELADATDPRLALERRRNLGGSSRERMAAWHADREQRVAAARAWSTGETARIAAAREAVREMASQ